MRRRRPLSRGFARPRSTKIPWTISNTTIGYTQDPGTTQAITTICTNTTGNKILKVKHITISANVVATSAVPVYWALVYVPQTQTPSTLDLISGNQIYEPNQFLMASGCFIADTDSEPVRIYTPLARKLHPSTGVVAGDTVRFITLGGSATAYQFVGLVKYATQ